MRKPSDAAEPPPSDSQALAPPRAVDSGSAPALRGGASGDTAPALRGGASGDTAPALRGGASGDTAPALRGGASLFSSSGTHRAPQALLAEGPLDARDLELLARAGERMRSLRRAIWLASMNGGTLLFCALACVPFALFDAALLLPALALGASGAAELRGARMLRDCDLRAPRWLVTNQFALLALIAMYCVLSGVRALSAPSAAAELAGVAPGVAEQLRDAVPGLDPSGEAVDRGYRALVVAFYAAVFAACAVYQGLCAQFYRSRGAVLRAFVDETPPWVREAQRRLSG